MDTKIIAAITIGLLIGLAWGMGIMYLNLRYKRRKHMVDVLRSSIASHRPNLKTMMVTPPCKEVRQA